MSDVRALLKAKRQEARINHPYASYNSSGQLKCLICDTAVKHASAWEGHLGSKAHRTNVIRLREQQREQSQIKEDGEDENVNQEEEGQSHTPDSSVLSKRKTPDDITVDERTEKRRNLEKKSLPTDFFSDPSRAPILLSDDSDEDDPTTLIAQPPPQPNIPKSAIDLEYELFQRELTRTMDTYDRATIIAEPVGAPTSNPGFPVTNIGTKEDELTGPTEEEIRRNREQEEKELIMDRLLEEERAQEDADTRVLLLKNRVELLRKKRQEARTKKSMSKTSV